MGKLYDFNIDRLQWVIKNPAPSQYIFQNLLSSDSIVIESDIYGIEQISYDTFLINRFLSSKRNELIRIRITGSLFFEEFRISFSEFYFYSDHIIVFDNRVAYNFKAHRIEDDFDFEKSKEAHIT